MDTHILYYLKQPTIYLLIVVFFDLLFRKLAYDKIDSLAIDICVFTTVYELIELCSRGGEETLWKFIISLIITVTAVIMHIGLRTHISSKIVQNHFDCLLKNTDSEKDRKIAILLRKIGQKFIEVDLSKTKPDKKEKRQNFIKLLGELGLKKQDVNEEKIFVLTAPIRYLWLAIFILIGTMELILLTPIIKF